jgi:hypothetical protein
MKRCSFFNCNSGPVAFKIDTINNISLFTRVKAIHVVHMRYTINEFLHQKVVNLKLIYYLPLIFYLITSFIIITTNIKLVFLIFG